MRVRWGSQHAEIQSASSERRIELASRPSRAPLRWTFLCMFLTAVITIPQRVAGQDGVISRESKIKAAYLFNFGKYVQWPATAQLIADDNSPPFVLGIVGTSSVTAPLRAIAASKSINGRRLVIRRISGVDDAQACQILFVPRDHDDDLTTTILAEMTGEPTLIVGESEGFAETHGMINFFIEGNRLRFEINKTAAERAGLRISAQLLKLGVIVTPAVAAE